MLALYCQTKHRERKERNNYVTEIIKYYTELECFTKVNNESDLPKCRVCLQNASIYIYKERNREDVVEALKLFGNIDLNSEDQYPKHLCRICWQFIRGAILFRKIAIKSNKVLSKKTDESSRKSDDSTPIDLTNDDLNQEDNDDIADDIWNSHSNTHFTDDFAQENADIIEDNIFGTKDQVKSRKPQKKMIKCNICDKVMNTKYYYDKHVALHDPNAAKNIYICEKCGKEFKSPQAIADHQVIHTGKFPFKCDHCPYRGRTRDALSIHRRRHIGVKKHLCIHCPAQFYSSSNLKRHMFKHQTPQFQCNECEQAFHTESLLKKHVDVNHLGIKPHVCDICGKAFGYRKQLTTHLKGVHKRALLPAGRMPAYLVEQAKLNTTQDE